MKQLLIISGKGGTGKTTLATAFIKLAEADTFADCDVEAPNLHLLLHLSGEAQISDYYGMDKAIIDTNRCIGCGLCAEHCRFDAISKVNNHYQVEIYSCEGCGVCEIICPEKAVSMEKTVSGRLELYKNDFVFSTAQLRMGYGVSGKLVASVKKQLLDEVTAADLIIIDGSPGIGCPVIASLSGVDLALIVTEPSISAISDLERIVRTAKIFEVDTAVCINKYDIDLDNSNRIQSLCERENIVIVGRIPFDETILEAVNNQKSIIDYHCDAADAVKEVWENLVKLLVE